MRHLHTLSTLSSWRVNRVFKEVVHVVLYYIAATSHIRQKCRRWSPGESLSGRLGVKRLAPRRNEKRPFCERPASSAPSEMSKSSITVFHHALRNRDVSGQVKVMCSKTFEKGFLQTEHRSNEVSGSVHSFTMNLQSTISWIFLGMSQKN